MRPTLPATVLVSALVSAVMYLLMHIFVGPHLPVSDAEVPSLGGLAPDQARTVLATRGLLLVLEGERPDEKAMPGTLTGQLPLGGSRVRRGDEVHAFLATQPPAVQVPVVAGLAVDAARDALGRAKLRPGAVTSAASDAVAKGLVASSTPAAGSELRPGSPVDLVVSTGPDATPVPQLVGKRVTRARELLQGAGLLLGATRTGSNDDFDQGVIIGQTPPSGTAATRGSKVDVVVND